MKKIPSVRKNYVGKTLHNLRRRLQGRSSPSEKFPGAWNEPRLGRPGRVALGSREERVEGDGDSLPERRPVGKDLRAGPGDRVDLGRLPFDDERVDQVEAAGALEELLALCREDGHLDRGNRGLGLEVLEEAEAPPRGIHDPERPRD